MGHPGALSRSWGRTGRRYRTSTPIWWGGGSTPTSRRTTAFATPCPLRSPSAFLASTRGGFTGGITMATVIGAAIVVVAAAVVALFLPAHPKGPAS
jgi:hypothetical protein